MAARAAPALLPPAARHALPRARPLALGPRGGAAAARSQPAWPRSSGRPACAPTPCPSGIWARRGLLTSAPGCPAVAQARRGLSTAGRLLEQVQRELAGRGEATEQELRAAEDAVERAGGRVLQAPAAAALSHLELPRGEEAAAGARLAAELGLEGDEAARLSQAAEAGHGEAQLVLDERQGRELTSRQVSYRVWRDKASGQVLVAYGTCSARLDVDGAALGAAQDGPPADHCVEHEGRTFAVLPWRPPGDRTDGLDMIKERDDNWIDIPAGWRPYEVCADFASMVRPKVIAAHPWGTDVLLVRKGVHWPAIRTAMRAELGGHYSAGNRYCSHVDWFEVSKDGKKCVFRGEEPSFTPSKKLEPVFRPWSGRVLIERVPQSTLLEEWRKYLDVKARAEWWAALGPA